MIDFSTAYPNSRKVYEERGALRVPMREVSIQQGAGAIRLYDTSGPQGHDVRDGLPKLRIIAVDRLRGPDHMAMRMVTPATAPLRPGRPALRRASAERARSEVIARRRGDDARERDADLGQRERDEVREPERRSFGNDEVEAEVRPAFGAVVDGALA